MKPNNRYLLSIFLSFSILLTSGLLSLSEAQSSDDDDFFDIGGALRFNFYHTDYGGGTNPNDTQFTLDMWRINAVGQRSGVGINFEYRFYPTFNTHFIKQGWLDYSFSDRTEIQVGVTQVPFGNLQYNSHNWWFQGPYYVGLEDDHDMGFKLIHTRSNWDLMLGYFVQPEPAGPAYGEGSFGIGGAGRYSYDIIPITGNAAWDYVLGDGETPQSNQEKNQFNIRSTYNFEHGNGNSQVGGSLQYGGIYNSALDESGSRTAFAAHLDGNYGNFNVKAQYTYLTHDALNDDGESVDFVYMAAYGDPYAVATEMSMYSLGIAYSKDVDFGPVSNLNFYNNYTLFEKRNEGFFDSHQNVLGFMATMGDVFIYFDIASGKNHPWLTNDFGTGMAQGVEDPRTNTRFNINIGYYF
ncbi:MAG: hypothetical protein JJU46_06560 [Balneolaceae bacterium]|nr:hypothetical protein [Balneolaceae bacterium]MCH8548978.1 hypothetical protein [Balneolaceae bacterium]